MQYPTGPYRLRTALRAALCAIAVATIAPAAAPGRASGQIPPADRYRELESAHFHVTYGSGLESVARRVMATAERSWDLLESTLSPAPEDKVDILVVDAVDFSNGFAGPFPSNRIVLYARPPVDDAALNYSTDWIELVVSHELTHAFHMDRAGGIGRLLRSVFGRMPLIYPMFPAVGTPAWSTEGLAVDLESAYTGEGRARGSEHDMIVRTAILEGQPDRMDRLNESSPIWPGDQRAYIYGSLFMDFLSERYGDDVHSRILDRTASAIAPPFLFFDNVAYHAFGETFDEAYAHWLVSLRQRYSAIADSLTARGLSQSTPLTTHGRIAFYPRVSPDGQRLAYTASDGKSSAAIRVIDPGTGRRERSSRRNGEGVQAWTPDGGLVISQFELDGLYRLYSDLWLEGSGGRRLTRQARLQAPDVSRAGRIVAVANGEGRTALELVDIATGDRRPIIEAGPRTQWSSPRWSPDGARIAVSRWSGDGEHAIVVLDTTGTVLTTVVAGRELNLGPAWTPEGRYLLFSSDRTGITNLYAADLSTPTSPRLSQVTNVLTGAFQPEVSPDGRTIYFSKYHADGYAIERMPFDPATWRVLPPASLKAQPGIPDRTTGTRGSAPSRRSPGDPEAGVDSSVGPDGESAQIESRPYSAWRTLAPRFWAPILTTRDAAGTYVGAAISGRDLIGRHAFTASLARDVRGSSRWEGDVSYANARLGNPVLTVNARRRWNGFRTLLPDQTFGDRVEREDALSAFLTFAAVRWRTSATLAFGLRRQWFTQHLIDESKFRLIDPEDAETHFIASFSIANTQRPAYSISREDGFTFAILGERSIEDASTAPHDSTGIRRENFTEWRTIGALYKSIDAGGFAHHVLALRGSGYLATGSGIGFQKLGGETGGYTQVLGFGVTEGSRLLPVRGFDPGVIAGSRAWSATAEWRAPIALVGRRPAFSPVFIDRVSASAFADAGDAWCSAGERRDFTYCGTIEQLEKPIVGAGAELALDFGFAGIATARARGGFGVPVRGPRDGTRFYLIIGSNF